MVDRVKQSARLWTQKEIEDLIVAYPHSHLAPERLTAYFGRSEDAIERKARRLGLKRPNLQRPWTSVEDAALINIFPNTNFSHEEMVGYFNRSWSSIQNRAWKLGLHRQDLSHKLWTSQEEAELVQVYPNTDISVGELERYFGRSWNAIKCKARSLDLSRPRNLIQVKRDYFHLINEQEKAYWLGFLAADGSVICKDGRYIIFFALQEKDRHWLERYRDTVAPGAAIAKYRDGLYMVTISSKEMVEDLMRYGLLPNKTHSLAFPTTISDEYVASFILGYFDGDGSLGKYGYSWRWEILGTLPFLTVARQYIQAFTGIEIREPVRKNKKSPNLYVLYAYGQRAVAVDRVLNTSGLGLPRKHLPPQ
jgi:hypothetical protein